MNILNPTCSPSDIYKLPTPFRSPVIQGTRCRIVNVMSLASVEVDTRLVPNDGLMRLGSKEAQLASRSFWGKDMLQQRLCDLAEESRRRSLPSSHGLPSLRRHSQVSTISGEKRQPQAPNEYSGDSSASDGSATNSPMLAGRQRCTRRSKTRQGMRTYCPAPVNGHIRRTSSDELLPHRSPSNLPPMRLGSKEAKLAASPFWGHEMLQRRLNDLATESSSDKSDSESVVALPPLKNHRRPRPHTGFSN